MPTLLPHFQIRAKPALCLCLLLAHSHIPASDLEPVLYTASPKQATASSNWNDMFHRTEPRGLDRFPDSIEENLKDYGGWYTQFTWTTTWQTRNVVYC